MRIALVGPTYPFRGGIAHYNTVLYRELSKRHEVFLVSLKRQYPRILFPGRTQRDESRDILAVDNDPILTPLNPLTWRRATERLASLKPDLVVFQWWHPFFGPAFGSVARGLRRRGIRVAFLCHNGRAHERSRIDDLLAGYALRAADAFIAHSNEDASALREAVPDTPITVSPHPSYDCFQNASHPIGKSEARGRIGVGEDDEVLLFFGYVRRYKGLPVLLEAMPKLRHGKARLLVVGEFYHGGDEARETVRDLGIADRVTFVDRYVANEEVAPYFVAADAVILPYRSASQSGIVQIAYAFGRPVVATRVGGLPEVVDEGETGFLCEPENPDALASAIDRILDADRASMRGAIERGRDRFSWDRMVEVVEGIAGEADQTAAASPRTEAPSSTASTTDASRGPTISAS